MILREFDVNKKYIEEFKKVLNEFGIHMWKVLHGQRMPFTERHQER